MASETPVAMDLASAEPSAAIESKTLNIPTTVPTKPKRGHIGTNTPKTSKLWFMPELSREIIAALIWREAQLILCERACHFAKLVEVNSGNTLLKYQTRSNTMVHIITQLMNI